MLRRFKKSLTPYISNDNNLNKENFTSYVSRSEVFCFKRTIRCVILALFLCTAVKSVNAIETNDVNFSSNKNGFVETKNGKKECYKILEFNSDINLGKDEYKTVWKKVEGDDITFQDGSKKIFFFYDGEKKYLKNFSYSMIANKESDKIFQTILSDFNHPNFSEQFQKDIENGVFENVSKENRGGNDAYSQPIVFNNTDSEIGKIDFCYKDAWVLGKFGTQEDIDLESKKLAEGQIKYNKYDNGEESKKYFILSKPIPYQFMSRVTWKVENVGKKLSQVTCYPEDHMHEEFKAMMLSIPKNYTPSFTFTHSNECFKNHQEETILDEKEFLSDDKNSFRDQTNSLIIIYPLDERIVQKVKEGLPGGKGSLEFILKNFPESHKGCTFDITIPGLNENQNIFWNSNKKEIELWEKK